MTFSDSAHLYDVIYGASRKDYNAESAHVRAIIQRFHPDARTLLDIACGTGQHVARLSGHFDCWGVDIDENLLAYARRRCPEVRFDRGDMLRLRLDRTFDVVTCLFASIGYMTTEGQLAKALNSMAGQVRDGGMLIVELCSSPDEWSTDLVGTVVVEHDDISVARMGSSQVNGRVAEIELQYLVGRPGTGVTHLVEQHELGLFTPEEYLLALSSTGLSGHLLPAGPGGRRFLVGLKLPTRQSERNTTEALA